MDIEDIIKAIAPFAFIIFWVVSSVLGSIKQGQPARTSRPVFTPTKPEFGSRPGPVNKQVPSVWDTIRLETEDEEDDNFAPWRERPRAKLDTESQPAPEINTFQKLRQFMEERIAEAKAAEAKSAMVKPSVSVEEGDRQSVSYNQSVNTNLGQLVPDHAADVHLEQMQKGTVGSLIQRPVGPYADLASRLKNPQSARDALVMSIVLGEPKSKQAR